MYPIQLIVSRERGFLPSLLFIIWIACTSWGLSTSVKADSADNTAPSDETFGWYHTIKGRPVLKGWNAKYQPETLSEWSAKRRKFFLHNQMQIQTLLEEINQLQCSSSPCLLEKDKADLLRSAPEEDLSLAIQQQIAMKEQLQSYGRDGLVRKVIMFAFAAYGLEHVLRDRIFRKGAMYASVAAAAGYIVYLMRVTMSNNAIINNLVLQKRAHDKAMDARRLALHNIALLEGGHLLTKITAGLRKISQKIDIQQMKHVQPEHLTTVPGFALSSLQNLMKARTDNEGFILRLRNRAYDSASQSNLNIPVDFQMLRYNGRFYAVLPHPKRHLFFEFPQASQALAFFSRITELYHSDIATLSSASLSLPDEF